jgi:hypothetical protein
LRLAQQLDRLHPKGPRRGRPTIFRLATQAAFSAPISARRLERLAWATSAWPALYTVSVVAR